jgi:hypothetical protein
MAIHLASIFIKYVLVLDTPRLGFFDSPPYVFINHRSGSGLLAVNPSKWEYRCRIREVEAPQLEHSAMQLSIRRVGMLGN